MSVGNSSNICLASRSHRLRSWLVSRSPFFVRIRRQRSPPTNSQSIVTLSRHGPFDAEEVILLSAYASRTENPDPIDSSVVQALDDPTKARAGIKLLDFKPFNPVDKRTEITYREESTGKLKRSTKGMAGIVIDLCTRNKTEKSRINLKLMSKNTLLDVIIM